MRHDAFPVIAALWVDLFHWRHGRRAKTPRSAKPATCTECRDGETPDGGYCNCPKGQQLLADAIGADYETEATHIFGARR